MLDAKNVLKKTTVQGFSQARALLFTLESLPLPILHKWIVGNDRRLPTKQQQQYIIRQARRLLERDAQDFVDLQLPVQSLVSDSLKTHVPRWFQIMGDSTVSFWRRRQNATQVFSKKVKNLEDFPDYYQRNFHHQTDGYLSDKSAYFYEHQVELLFRGLADPMRRRLLKPLIKKLKGKKNPRILEIACGTGTFTRYLAEALPQASITAVDISPSYVQHAKQRFLSYKNVDFMVANAEDLPFKDESFDAVVSVFLHHELPRKVREQVIVESLRVCTKNGFWGLLDSIQLGDDPELDWAIKEFPKNFHEPFFTNYIKSPLHEFVSKKYPQRNFKEKNHLLSKVLYSD